MRRGPDTTTGVRDPDERNPLQPEKLAEFELFKPNSTRRELLGLLGYSDVEASDEHPAFIFIHNVAVLPRYQRKGIGRTLLEQVKDVARDRLPIIVRNVNDVAIRLLAQAGFWEIPGFVRNRRFKWSNLPGYQNNNTPWPEYSD